MKFFFLTLSLLKLTSACSPILDYSDTLISRSYVHKTHYKDSVIHLYQDTLKIRGEAWSYHPLEVYTISETFTLNSLLQKIQPLLTQENLQIVSIRYEGGVDCTTLLEYHDNYLDIGPDAWSAFLDEHTYFAEEDYDFMIKTCSDPNRNRDNDWMFTQHTLLKPLRGEVRLDPMLITPVWIDYGYSCSEDPFHKRSFLLTWDEWSDLRSEFIFDYKNPTTKLNNDLRISESGDTLHFPNEMSIPTDSIAAYLKRPISEGIRNHKDTIKSENITSLAPHSKKFQKRKVGDQLLLPYKAQWEFYDQSGKKVLSFYGDHIEWFPQIETLILKVKP